MSRITKLGLFIMPHWDFFPALKYDPVTFPLLLQSTVLTICCLDVVAFPPSKLHLQKLHGPVQQAVNHLKARVLVVVNGRQAPAVPGAHIWFVETGNDSVGNTETGLNHTTR